MTTINQVPQTPPLTVAPSNAEGITLRRWAIDLLKSLTSAMGRHANAINMLIRTGETLPQRVPKFAKANLPPAADNTGGIVYVSDEAGGSTLAFSDGTDWRRVQDRAIVS